MIRRASLFACLLAMAVAVPAAAQPLGTFRWQLQPYCNIVSVTVVQQGGQYQLDGTDDQCGAARKASVTGLAFLNPDGTVGFGLAIVTTPGGAPVHVDATVAIATLSGTWHDSAGAGGPFTFTPGAGSGGSARPAMAAGDITSVAAGTGLSGGGGAGDVSLGVDYAATQQRVSGVCAAGQHMTGVNQDGTVSCAASPAGDITGVTAGAGLTGGGAAGDISLAATFGGPGAAAAAARSDHAHQAPGNGNTAVGEAAFGSNTTGSNDTAVGRMALASNTTGVDNVAVGTLALNANTAGTGNVGVGSQALLASTAASFNVGVGVYALTSSVIGTRNTAVGSSALSSTNNTDNTAVGYTALGYATGFGNTAVGSEALAALTTGPGNVAVGYRALFNNTAGTGNVAVGTQAGFGSLGGNNIYLGNSVMGPAGENNAIHIGNPSNTTAFITGISGATASGGVAVFVNGSHQLGTLTSSARFKDGITPLGESLHDRVQALVPVRFVYKPEYDDGSKLTQYGLIAEDVAETFPELLVRDADGRPQTVRYHLLTPLLLAEVQRLERARAAAEQARDTLEARVKALEAALATLVEKR